MEIHKMEVRFEGEKLAMVRRSGTAYTLYWAPDLDGGEGYYHITWGGSSGASAFCFNGESMEPLKSCPRCHSDEVVPIVYGMPGSELVEEFRAGRVALGGSVVWPEAPEWRCVRCGFEWREVETGP